MGDDDGWLSPPRQRRRNKNNERGKEAGNRKLLAPGGAPNVSGERRRAHTHSIDLLLPDTALLHVASFLRGLDLARLSAVCRSWRAILRPHRYAWTDYANNNGTDGGQSHDRDVRAQATRDDYDYVYKAGAGRRRGVLKDVGVRYDGRDDVKEGADIYSGSGGANTSRGIDPELEEAERRKLHERYKTAVSALWKGACERAGFVLAPVAPKEELSDIEFFGDADNNNSRDGDNNNDDNDGGTDNNNTNSSSKPSDGNAVQLAARHVLSTCALRCDIDGCRKVFRGWSSFDNHWSLTHRKGTRYKAVICRLSGCSKKFVSMEALESHRMQRHPIEAWPYPCAICRQSFVSPFAFEGHVRNAHLISPKANAAMEKSQDLLQIAGRVVCSHPGGEVDYRLVYQNALLAAERDPRVFAGTAPVLGLVRPEQLAERVCLDFDFHPEALFGPSAALKSTAVAAADDQKLWQRLPVLRDVTLKTALVRTDASGDSGSGSGSGRPPTQSQLLFFWSRNFGGVVGATPLDAAIAARLPLAEIGRFSLSSSTEAAGALELRGWHDPLGGEDWVCLFSRHPDMCTAAELFGEPRPRYSCSSTDDDDPPVAIIGQRRKPGQFFDVAIRVNAHRFDRFLELVTRTYGPEEGSSASDEEG
jgi:F-box-like